MNAFEAMQSLRAEIQEETAGSFQDTALVAFLNEGARQVALKAHPIEKELLFAPISGVREYPISRHIPDLMGLRQITYKNRPMLRLTDADDAAMYTTSYQNTSDYSWRFKITRGNLILYPIPLVTTLAGVSCTLTQDSINAVVTAGTPMTSGAAFGWMLGVGATPTVWYPIRNVTDAAITLERPFNEATAAGTVVTLTDGMLRVFYYPVPPRLRVLSTAKVYYSTGTVTPTFGSKVVVGTATAWGKEIVQGMKFGIGYPTDDFSTGHIRPNCWYTVRWVTDSTHLILEEPYQLETLGAPVPYLLTDPSPFAPHEEWTTPMVFWAALKALSEARRPSEEIAGLYKKFGASVADVISAANSIEGLQTIAVPQVRLVDEFTPKLPFGWV